MVHRILYYMEPPNAMLQAEDMDLFTGEQLINSASVCIENMCSETELVALLERCQSGSAAEQKEDAQ